MSAAVFGEYPQYFTEAPQAICRDNIISDESLFRDYSRFGDRKVDFNRVRNPFTLAKYAISNYDKTWFTRIGTKPEQSLPAQRLLAKPKSLLPRQFVVEGPFSSYEMDKKFKARELGFEDQVGISRQEFFDFKYLVEIVYPLPKVRAFDGSSVASRKGETQTTVGAGERHLSHLFKSAKKFNRIWDESDRASVGFSEAATPFKRTPFKHILGANPKEKPNKQGFIEVDDALLQSAKKSRNLLNVNETFIVKSWKKAFPRAPKSSQGENKRRRVFASLTDVKANKVRKHINFREDKVAQKIVFIKEETPEKEGDAPPPAPAKDESDSDSFDFKIKEAGGDPAKGAESDSDSFDFDIKEDD